ncbi:hypothetical protein BH11PLA1_BH11PLA1_10900 [soil metagenome]
MKATAFLFVAVAPLLAGCADRSLLTKPVLDDEHVVTVAEMPAAVQDEFQRLGFRPRPGVASEYRSYLANGTRLYSLRAEDDAVRAEYVVDEHGAVHHISKEAVSLGADIPADVRAAAESHTLLLPIVLERLTISNAGPAYRAKATYSFRAVQPPRVIEVELDAAGNLVSKSMTEKAAPQERPAGLIRLLTGQ